MPEINNLIKQCQAGDDRAAETLYNLYRNSAFRLAYGVLGQREEAEEAAQDALVYALTRINRYDGRRASFTTWLHTITISRCRDRLRRRQLSSLSLTAWLNGGGDRGDGTPTPESQMARVETRDQVWEAVQGLSPLLREAILLRYWADHSYQEMATILGCSLRTAQSRVRLAYEQLRARLTVSDLLALSEGESVE